jgi:hypothetical protein
MREQTQRQAFVICPPSLPPTGPGLPQEENVLSLQAVVPAPCRGSRETGAGSERYVMQLKQSVHSRCQSEAEATR